MLVFTATKLGGMKDDEFAAYTRLLEDIGFDVSNSPRIPEPGTNKRWLYAWTKREEAERFARELRVRTRDTTWTVHSFDTEVETRGPVAPLDINSIHDAEGMYYYLTPASRERIANAYPHARLSPTLFVSNEMRDDLVQNHGPIWWTQVCKLLAGLTEEQIEALGGYRVLFPDGRVWHEEMPAVSAACPSQSVV